MAVPLAWSNLTHDKRRLVISLGGIGFAVLLMLMQVGFQAALLDSTTALPRSLIADLVIRSHLRYALLANEAFPERRLVQARGVPGVASAEPLYLRYTLYNHPDASTHALGPSQPHGETQAVSSIRLLAFDPDRPVLRLPGLEQYAEALRQPETVLLDSASKRELYGPIAPGVMTEVAGRRAEVVGLFRLGTDFVNDGNLITATRNLDQYAPSGWGEPPATQMVDLGLVRVAEGENVAEVQRRLQERFARLNDVDVLTQEELIQQEQRFWQRSTPIGTVFNIGLGIGFVVGTIICYQVLFSGMAQHLPEFATLKAMGYGNGYFLGYVVQQAAMLTLLGFIPGAIASYFLYQILSEQTGLQLALTLPRGGLVLGLTFLMCLVSGMLAVRKVINTDPASLFK